MPYIPHAARGDIDDRVAPLAKVIKTKGEANYAITKLVHALVRQRGEVTYSSLQDGVGLLECVKAEFLRAVVGPYEDMKRDMNGPVDLDGENDVKTVQRGK